LSRIERALERAPEDPQLVRGRGLLLAQSGRHQEALAAFEAALALGQADVALRAQLHYLRAEALFELGRSAEARRALDQALASPQAGAAEWRAAAVRLRDRLESAVPPQGARGKSFSLIGGKLFPNRGLKLSDRLGRNDGIIVESATCTHHPGAHGLAPELHSKGQPKGSQCVGYAG
jgi:tetratricopeptide (TPR) repeat protein